jgi:hypothetical protein
MPKPSVPLGHLDSLAISIPVAVPEQLGSPVGGGVHA